LRSIRFPDGLEAHLYSNVVEFWRHGEKLLALTPQQYGEVHRFIRGELEEIASDPIVQIGAAFPRTQAKEDR
jgi:hypothetical protein